MAAVPADAALPVVTSQPDVYRIFRGEAIRLPVATNTELTRVEWRFNGRVISNPVNTTLYTVNSKTATTLVVPNATPANSGNYVAHLTNKDGTALSRTISVTVLDKESPLAPWKSVLPGTVGFEISSLAHFNGRFVAGTADSTIHVSSDGERWQQAVVPPNPLRAMAFQPRIRKILSHNDRYFAFADPDDLNNNGVGGWTSSDLLSWEFDPNLPRIGNAAVSNGQRMVVTRYLPKTLASSTDGINWERASSTSPFWNSFPERLVAFKGSFLALTYSSTAPLYRSEDGVNWTKVTTPVPDGFKNFTGFGQFVEYNGELLFFGSQRLWKSLDGIAWTEVISSSSNPLGMGTPTAAFTGLGKVWISYFNGDCRNSSDLVNWHYLPYNNNSASPTTAVAGTEDVAVCAFNPSGIALTRDANTNFKIFPADGITATSGLTSTSAGIFAHTSPFVRFSEDGEVWKMTNAFRYSSAGGYDALAYGNGIYVRTNSTRRYVSLDGLAWREESQSGFYSDADLIFGNGRFVTLFPNFSSFDVSWSENGTTWSKKAAVQIKAKRLAYVSGRIWALATGYSTGTGGSREYLYATSGDAESWQSRSVALPPDANLVNVSGLVEFAGRLILVSGDPAWWLVSDDGGITWNRLDTGFGFLYNNPYSLNANSARSPVIHNGWLFAAFGTDDMIATSDGRNFNRLDGPGGSMTTHLGALFAATSGGVQRSGDISIPALQTFGLAEGASPVRGGTSEIGIVITDYQAGDRIEFRINGQLVQVSYDFYVHFAWNVGVIDEQTLVVTVIRADGSRTSRSWKTDPAAEVITQALPPGLPASGRLAFQQESAGFFYHLTPEGILRSSTDLFNWTSETIPGLANPSTYDINSLRIVTRADGARLLSLQMGIWASPPGSGTWTAVEDFPRALNGATYYVHPSGSHFTLLYNSFRVVPRPPELGGGGAYVNDLERFTSTDGFTWTSHGLLPSVGNYNEGFSDGTTILWIEDKGFDERAVALTPARLWRLTAAGVSEVVELLPDLTPYKVSFSGGKWIVLGGMEGDWELGIDSIPKILTSENTVTWLEGETASPDVGLWEISAYGNGLWIGRDSSGYFTTADFQTWTPIRAFPSLPVWTGNRWVNSEPKGNGPIDHYESDDLIEWRLVSAEWPTSDSTILAVTGERLVTTLGKGIFTMDATGKWAILSSRNNVTACQFWNGVWILAASDGGVGNVREGVSEHWQYPLNAPQPISSSASEVVLGFLENGSELIAFSNRALYLTTDGQSWSRRDTPPNRSVAGLVRLDDRLIVETSGKRIESSNDGGHTWTTATLPAGSVNYSTGHPGPYGLYADNDSAYYIANYNQRYRSDDGVTWLLLPSNTDAYLPRADPDGAGSGSLGFFRNIRILSMAIQTLCGTNSHIADNTRAGCHSPGRVLSWSDGLAACGRPTDHSAGQPPSKLSPSTWPHGSVRRCDSSRC